MNTLYKFSASWCQPCKMLSTIISTVDTSSINLIEIDIDEDTDKAIEFKIRSVPTLVLCDSEGNELKRKVGLLTKTELESFIGE
jgi:thioredoxin 1